MAESPTGRSRRATRPIRRVDVRSRRSARVQGIRKEEVARSAAKKPYSKGPQTFALCALHATVGHFGHDLRNTLTYTEPIPHTERWTKRKGPFAVAPFVPALPEGLRRRCSDKADGDSESSSKQSQACLKRSLVLSQGSLVMSAFNSNRGLINALAGLGGPVPDYRVTHIRMATTSPFGLLGSSFEHIELMRLST
jgi:hypothetical protein